MEVQVYVHTSGHIEEWFEILTENAQTLRVCVCAEAVEEEEWVEQRLVGGLRVYSMKAFVDKPLTRRMCVGEVTREQEVNAYNRRNVE